MSSRCSAGGQGGDAVSSRIFQGVIIQMKDATERTIGVVDPEGLVVASSDLSLIGTNIGTLRVPYDESADKTVRSDGMTFKALGVRGVDDYSVFADGEDDLAKTVCIMASIAISEAGIYF